MRTLRGRSLWFGLYLLVNLAIILFSTSLWLGGKPTEAIFVGLWAPTLDLLYLMFLATFDPFRRAAAHEPRVVSLRDDARVA